MMRQLELKLIKMLAAQESISAAHDYLRSNTANILLAKEERVEAELVYELDKYKVVIQKNEERNFDTSCNCDTEEQHPLCVHKVIVLLQLLHAYGPGYFDTIRNRDKDKNKLLAIYGYSLNDDLKGKFEFIYKEGKPFLKVLDPSIKRVVAPTSSNPLPIQQAKPVVEIPEVVEEEEIKQAVNKLGVVIVNITHQYPFVQAPAHRDSRAARCCRA